MTKEEIIKVIDELECFEPYEKCVPPYYLINEMPMQFIKLRSFINEYYASDRRFTNFKINYNITNKYMNDKVKSMSAREMLDSYDKIDFANLWFSQLVSNEILKDIGKRDTINSIKQNEDVILFNQIMYAKYSIPKEMQKLKGGVVLSHNEAQMLYELSIKLRYGNIKI